MQKIGLFFITVIVALVLSGCTQKVTIRALEPAEVDRVAYTKKIAVSDFSNDRVGLSDKIEADLAQITINHKNYFTMVSRDDFHKLIKEQKIQNSGLINQSTAVNIGNLIGAQAIISGHVGNITSQDTYFYEERVRCADKKCKKLAYYNVRCKKRVIGLSAELRIVDVEKGDILYAETMNPTATYTHCADDSRAIPSRGMAAQKLAIEIANTFTYKLTPHYRSFHVELLDDPDLDYTDRQAKLLKVSLEYIKQSRYDKAEQFLIQLINSTKSQSYVALYDLGVIKEAQGKYKDAKELYAQADHLMIEPVEEINQAVIRIEKLIQERKKTREQLNR